MITAIMTIWKRNNVEEQIEALLNQTVKPSVIWIYHCGFNVEPDMNLCKKYPMVSYQSNSGDLGYFGRFSLALHAKTPYVYILDDDVIPSETWLERCISLCSDLNCIISPAGRIIPPNDFRPELPKNHLSTYLRKYFIGDNDSSLYENFCEQDTYVDFGCNSWFIKTEWLFYFWSFKPYSTSTGEDIHLSITSMLRGNVKTLVPAQMTADKTGNLKKYYGHDQHASWKKADFIMQREAIIKDMVKEKKWKPILW